MQSCRPSRVPLPSGVLLIVNWIPLERGVTETTKQSGFSPGVSSWRETLQEPFAVIVGSFSFPSGSQNSGGANNTKLRTRIDKATQQIKSDASAGAGRTDLDF